MSSEQSIWIFLLDKLGNAFGAAGLMGNLQAESALNPINLQQSYEKKLGFTDETYTSAVDDGSYDNFVRDSAGYGLAQWTYWSRKQNLLNYAKGKGTSIGDLQMQLEFLWEELQGYKKVLPVLQSATDVRTASDAVLIHFEAPANQSETVQEKRASYGEAFYQKYAGGNGMSIDYSKYINSTETHYISNSGSDENGKYSGGAAGDQTGNEWNLRSWYSRPWQCVLRHPNESVRLQIAKLGIAAALNNQIGYDQNQRGTYWTQLQKVGYDPSKITTACEADCSAGVIANTKATGHLLGMSALQNVAATYTGNMRSAFKAAGFTVLTDSKYLTSADYLLPGDILLNDGHHTATNVTYGSKVRPSTTTKTSASTTKKVTASKSASKFDKTIAGTYTTTADLNMRDGGGTSNKVLKVIPKGTAVKNYGYYTPVNGTNWLYVQVTLGGVQYTGFCSGKYLKKS